MMLNFLTKRGKVRVEVELLGVAVAGAQLVEGILVGEVLPGARLIQFTSSLRGTRLVGFVGFWRQRGRQVFMMVTCHHGLPAVPSSLK